MDMETLASMTIINSSLDSKAGLNRFFSRLDRMPKIIIKQVSTVQNLIHE